MVHLINHHPHHVDITFSGCLPHTVFVLEEFRWEMVKASATTTLRRRSAEHRAPVFTIDARGPNIGNASMAVIINEDVSLSWYKRVCERGGRNVDSTA